MKLNTHRSEQGSALILTVITCVLIGTVLGSYLLLITNRNTRALRATAWNAAIPVLEAGIEEALTHLQVDSNNPTGNGWATDLVDGQPVYWKTRALPDGSYFSVTNFQITSPSPYIRSAGYVSSPTRSNEFISRLVQVIATNPPSGFSRAIAADGPIKLSGSAVVDGFSSAGFPSAISAYNTPTNRNANGGIATNSKQVKAIDVGTAHVYGTAVTGPGGTVGTAGGTIGDFDWSATHTGVEPGWVSDTMNVQFQPNSPPDPNPAWLIPTVTTTPTGSNITVCGTGTYKMSSLVSLSKTRPVFITGDCTLWVNGDLSVSGDGYLYIAPKARLQLYVSGTASISGGGIVNGAGLPQNFNYYGLPSSKVLKYSGTANFIGTINAPQADMTLSGGASVFGAVICKSFNCSGGSSVHYDQSLVGKAIFMVTSWREL